MAEKLFTTQKIQRIAIFSSVVAVTGFLLVRNDFGPLILFLMGVIIGIIVGKNYLK